MNHQPLRVLMLCEYFPPFDRGGSEWSAYHLAKSLVQKGHRVRVFTPHFGYTKISNYENIPLFQFPFYIKLSGSAQVAPIHFSSPLWFIWTTYQLLKVVKIYRPDVLHVQGKYFITQALIVSKIMKIPTVATLRDYVVLCPLAYCIRPERGYHACSLLDLIAKDVPVFFAHFSAVSFFRKLYQFVGILYGWCISKLLQIGIKKIDTTVGISQKLSSIYKKNHVPVHKTIYNTLNLPDICSTASENYLLFVGRLTEGKGFSLICNVYAQLKGLPPLKVIGTGSTKTIQVPKQAQLLGRLSYRETLRIMQKARLLVVPSIWEEPFGRVALEGLSLGVPVVASNRGALPEIIEHQVSGVVVEPTVEEMIKGIQYGLRNEKTLRANIKKNHTNVVNKFHTVPVQEYEKLYQSLL